MSDGGEDPGFTLSGRARSFGYAFRGIAALLASQHNAWIHAVASVAVVVAGLVFGVSNLEWALLLMAIGLVWAAEAFNTAVEWLADVVSPQHDERIGHAKDVSAAGVLLAACGAAAAGLLVFLPRVFG